MITNWINTSPYITDINYTYDYDTSTTINGTSTTINKGIPL